VRKPRKNLGTNQSDLLTTVGVRLAVTATGGGEGGGVGVAGWGRQLHDTCTADKSGQLSSSAHNLVYQWRDTTWAWQWRLGMSRGSTIDIEDRGSRGRRQASIIIHNSDRKNKYPVVIPVWHSALQFTVHLQPHLSPLASHDGSFLFLLPWLFQLFHCCLVLLLQCLAAGCRWLLAKTDYTSI
jgi:hypothetical protein